MAWWVPLLEGLGAGAGFGFLDILFGGDDDSSSSDQLEASNQAARYNLLGQLASAKMAGQQTSSSKTTSADIGSLAETPSLGSSNNSSVTYPFSNQFSNSNLNSNTNLANALRSLLGQGSQYYT